MPLVYCDRSIVDYDQPEGIVVAVQPETRRSQAQAEALGALRPSAQRERPSRLRKVNGELATVLGPVALGANQREKTERLPAVPPADEAGDGGLPLLPTPPTTASTDFMYTLKLSGLPQLTPRKPGTLGTAHRAAVPVGSRSARETREHPGRSTHLKKAKTARSSDRADSGRGQRRLQGARQAASKDDTGTAMLVRSEYTGVERDLLEWAVEPQGYSKELKTLQQMQTGFDKDRMRTAELMAHITTKHSSMKEFDLMRGGDGFWDQEGRWKPLPFIACIRRYAWEEAARLLKWSLVGVQNRLTSRESKEYNGQSAKDEKKQDQQSYERPDYAVDTDQNANTALHHCLAPFQSDLSFQRGSEKSKNWHPQGSKGAVGTRTRPPPEFLSALIQANPAAISSRNRNGLTPLHFALGCTTTEINASVETIFELCKVCPEAVQVKTNTAELPLHLAAAKKAPESVLRKLIQIYPEACLQANCWGSLPIHVGLVNNMPESQIRLLIGAYPSTVGEVDEDGKTPCAIALTIGAPFSTVMFLVNQYPDCLSVRDANGLCPLALALINQAPETTILQLLEHYPRAVRMEASHSLELPLHIAIRHAQRHIRRLDRASTSRAGSSRGSRHRHDEGHVPSGMRRTGQFWPIQYKGVGEGFHVPPSRGGLPPSRQGVGGLNGGPRSRSSLATPSMKFTPQSLGTPETGLSAGAGGAATTTAGDGDSANAGTAGITLSAGAGFAPGSLEMPDTFGISKGHRFRPFLSRPNLPLQKVASVEPREDSKPDATEVRSFSTDAKLYLERIVGALIAADEDTQENRSPDRAREIGIAQRRTVEAVDLHGRTPLHVACFRQVPSSVLKLLVAANPAAVEEKDRDGWLPLHRYVNGPGYAAAEDSLLSVLTLLEVCPEHAAVQHAPVSVEQVKRQEAQRKKVKGTQIRDEMMATGLLAYKDKNPSGNGRPRPPKTKTNRVFVSAGRREAMEAAVRKRRIKAGLDPQSSDGQSAVTKGRPDDHQKEQQITIERQVRGSVKLDGLTDTVADPRRSRKEEEARLGRSLTKDEGLKRLAYMKAEQQKEQAIYGAKIAQMKADRHNGVASELFPYELAEKHRREPVALIHHKGAQMAEDVRTRTSVYCCSRLRT